MTKLVIKVFTMLFFLFSLISCAPSACECANILSDRTAEGDMLSRKAIEGNGTFEPRNEYWANKARKCMETYTDMKGWEIKAYQDAGRMISDEALTNAGKECGPETNFNDEQIKLACDCWDQSYSKSGLEFDNMNSSQQVLRKKCFELFKDEKNMEAACNQIPKNPSTETEADTKITAIQLPPPPKVPDNYFLLKESKGDLNKDKIIDKVLVFNDTINPQSVYKVKIYFGDSSGDYNLFLESNNAIIPQFPGAKNYDERFYEHSFDKIEIKNGLLIIGTQLTRGHYEYKYRYQNNTFELIGYSGSFGDGQGGVSSDDFNLSTGINMNTTSSNDSNLDKITKEIIKINPLPTIVEKFDIQKDVFDQFFFSGNNFEIQGKRITRTLN